MYVFHIRFPRKKARCYAALLAVVAVSALLLGGCLRHEEPTPSAAVTSNADRVAYLAEKGWVVTEEPVETLILQLPEDLSVDYADYSKLQRDQGFPFDQYGGRQVSRYTYAVTNYPALSQGVQANLYLCDDHVIAGDIIATGENGFRQGLTFPEKTEKAAK